jgi:rare lipoprotein A
MRPRFGPDWVLPCGLSDFGLGAGAQIGDYDMAFTDCAATSGAGTSCVDAQANRIHPSASVAAGAAVRSATRLFAVALGGSLLAACAQSSVVTRNSEFGAANRQQHRQTASLLTHRRLASTRKHTPFARHNNGTKTASQGVASFYTEGTETASGEKFDTHELTAAHPTLPFGTKLRVTNVSTGRSVTVRVNDRGPYVPGRVVDVSYSAADALGIVDKGIANVKLDVVH